MRRLELLLIDPKPSLFKTNKTINTTIKNNSNWSGRNDEYWLALARGGAGRRDVQHNTLEGGRKWSKLLHIAKKTPKNTKKITEKYVEDERGLGRGKRIRGERRSEPRL
jgi:hypothetical protein